MIVRHSAALLWYMEAVIHSEDKEVMIMKKGFKKIITFTVILALIMSLQTCVVLADTVSGGKTNGNWSQIQSDNRADDIINIEPLEKIDDVQVETRIRDNVATDEAVSALNKAGLDEEKRGGRDSGLQIGSLSGYLTQTDDYDIYYVPLSAGSYLQARLTIPSVSLIDYDLLLLDSSANTLKVSDYVTSVSGTDVLEESIGYIAGSSAEALYLCVYAVSGGSTSSPYTLEFSIDTSFDSGEPNENASEAETLSLSVYGTSVTMTLNSPLDNDWYEITVPDSPTYYRIKADFSSTSVNNSYAIQIYQNIGSNCYAMSCLGYTTGGIINFAPGTYLIRIKCTETLNGFDASDIPTYSMSLLPMSRIDRIVINNVLYRGQYLTEVNGIYSIYYDDTNSFALIGIAYYDDAPNGAAHPARNAPITVKLYTGSESPGNLLYSYDAMTSDTGTIALGPYIPHAYSGTYIVKVCSAYNSNATDWTGIIHFHNGV